MPLANFKELLFDARKNNYAVPCLEVLNIEMAIGQVIAAEEKKSPVIFAFAPHLMPSVPIPIIMPAIIDVANHALIPVAVQLDHGYDFDEIMNSINCGVSAVMFDGSELNYDENVVRTKEIIKIAHSLDVDVEAELGFVGGGFEDETTKASQMTDPEMVLDFVVKTNVDALAVSFGNLHGKYRGDPSLDLTRLSKIRAIVDTPLVMHGGSGLTEKDYKDIVDHGISNIHFYTYLAIGVWPDLEKRTNEIGRHPSYREIIKWTIEYYHHEAKKVMDMLDSTDKATVANRKSVYSDTIIK